MQLEKKRETVPENRSLTVHCSIPDKVKSSSITVCYDKARSRPIFTVIVDCFDPDYFVASNIYRHTFNDCMKYPKGVRVYNYKRMAII